MDFLELGFSRLMAEAASLRNPARLLVQQPVRARLVSSPNVTSNTQCKEFSKGGLFLEVWCQPDIFGRNPASPDSHRLHWAGRLCSSLQSGGFSLACITHDHPHPLCHPVGRERH